MNSVIVLGLIFITLKLTGFIAWSWWLVLIPFYPVLLVWIFLLCWAFYVGSKAFRK